MHATERERYRRLLLEKSGHYLALAQHLAASGLDSTTAARQAYGRLYRGLIAQATTLAYIDTCWMLAVGAGIMFLLSFVLRKNTPGAAGGVAAG